MVSEAIVLPRTAANATRASLHSKILDTPRVQNACSNHPKCVSSSDHSRPLVPLGGAQEIEVRIVADEKRRVLLADRGKHCFRRTRASVRRKDVDFRLPSKRPRPQNRGKARRSPKSGNPTYRPCPFQPGAFTPVMTLRDERLQVLADGDHATFSRCQSWRGSCCRRAERPSQRMPRTGRDPARDRLTSLLLRRTLSASVAPGHHLHTSSPSAQRVTEDQFKEMLSASAAGRPVPGNTEAPAGSPMPTETRAPPLLPHRSSPNQPQLQQTTIIRSTTLY